MNPVKLVTDIGNLITFYGLDSVQATVDYFNALSQLNTARVGDPATDVWLTISHQQFRDVGNLYRAGDEIAAIKLLREITACGLKEAKDVVEATRW